MPDTLASLRPLRAGLVLSLLALVFGFGLGALFGAAEDGLKGYLDREGRAVLDVHYGGDEAKLAKVLEKSWVYFQRAHLHANGLGATSLALILLLGTLPCRNALRAATSFALGAGALGYGLYWFLAGLRAPGLGGTGAAKESLAWLAWPSSGLCLVGLVAVLALAVLSLWGSRAAQA